MGAKNIALANKAASTTMNFNQRVPAAVPGKYSITPYKSATSTQQFNLPTKPTGVAPPTTPSRPASIKPLRLPPIGRYP